MRFLTHGDKNKPSLLLIHGMANTSSLFDPLLPYLSDYYVLVCELDGHSTSDDSEFVSIVASCEEIEAYVHQALDGELYGLLGFSLGGTIAAELIARSKIKVDRTILDAAFVIRMGFKKYPFKLLFQGAIWCLKKSIPIPAFMVERIMGKGNIGILDTLYRGVSMKTVGCACMACYDYEIPESLREYTNPVVYWYGENEPYPKKCVELLKEFLPQMKIIELKAMGHGQMLHEHPKAYADQMIKQLSNGSVLYDRS